MAALLYFIHFYPRSDVVDRALRLLFIFMLFFYGFVHVNHSQPMRVRILRNALQTGGSQELGRLEGLDSLETQV